MRLPRSKRTSVRHFKQSGIALNSTLIVEMYLQRAIWLTSQLRQKSPVVKYKDKRKAEVLKARSRFVDSLR